MSEYLRYVIQNTEPLRIADDSRCQSNQARTLRYIPGTTIRGYVINELAGTKEFEQIRRALFSQDVRFMNAYIKAGERDLLPSPKGFYEDKTMGEGKKKIENVAIKGGFSEGYKRAALGQYCYYEGDCIHYYSVATDSDMKIKINLAEGEKKNVFRNEYMTRGHVFTGYIAVDRPEVKALIKSVFDKRVIILGNARSAGFGKCSVLSCEEIGGLPYEDYMPEKDLEGSCYMMLLSNTAMRGGNGEICGIDWRNLSVRMGVEIEEERVICSTSTVDVRGYNRIWKSKIPSVVMYEQGSIFHIPFKGKLTLDSMRKLCDSGLGIRVNEGFGRVLFLRDYEKVCYKLSETGTKQDREPDELTKEDEKTLKKIAKTYYYNVLKREMDHYVVNNSQSMGNGSNSKLGTIASLATAYRYDPEQGVLELEKYLGHAMEKEEKNNTQKERSSIKKVKEFTESILNNNLEELLGIHEKDSVMGISKQELLSKTEEDKLKLALLVSMIRYENKEVK